MKYSAGYRSLELSDRELGINFPLLVMYPSRAAENPFRLSPFQAHFAVDAPIADGRFPLVMLSHGSGGTPVVYHKLAAQLAREGFVVGMPEHVFNNKNDNSFAGTIENLTIRPRHLKLSIDALFDSDWLGPHLVSDEVGVIGHSMGGYTALALAGGDPTPLDKEAKNGPAQRLDVTQDPRVKAIVLMAPATVWFRMPGSLAKVDAPILLMHGEKDELTPFMPHGTIIMDGVPDRSKVEVEVVQNGGHFSFLSPYPEAIRRAKFPPSQDPEGFDRELFAGELKSSLVRFLSKWLRGASAIG